MSYAGWQSIFGPLAVILFIAFAVELDPLTKTFPILSPTLLANAEVNGSDELRSTDGTRAGGDNGRGAVTSDNGSGDDAAYHSPGSHKRDQNDVSR